MSRTHPPRLPSIGRLAPQLATSLALALALISTTHCGEDEAPVEDAGGSTGADADLDAGDADRSDAAEVGGDEGLQFPPDFVFGAASSAHQIEGNNTNNNWYQFETLDQYAGMTEAPSGQAANGYVLWEEDNGRVEATHLDAYRFSVEWSRVMPRLGQFDEAEIAHYRAIIDDLHARGIRPFVTLHHFTDPIWLYDLRDLACEAGPSDENLCGWTNPDAVQAFVEYARRMAQEYGDRVDDWSTFNEPNTYSHIGYWLGVFPPGRAAGTSGLPFDDVWLERTAPVVRALIEAHVQAYRAIKQADTQDADGDGVAANVGWTMAIQYIVPADPESSADVAAADQYRQLLNFIYADAVANGEWDADLDGITEETHPEWQGTQDFVGVQYYSRVFAFDNPLDQYRVITFIPCLDLLADVFSARCPYVDPIDESFVNEVYPEGLYQVVSELAERYPGLPLPITENGAAADNGERKAQILVRHLAQVHRLVEDGYPVGAYYAWSLTDNFEWAHGFWPRFGLYRVDYQTFERTATRAQQVLAEVARTRRLSPAMLEAYAHGPLFPDDPETE